MDAEDQSQKDMEKAASESSNVRNSDTDFTGQTLTLQRRRRLDRFAAMQSGDLKKKITNQHFYAND